MPARAQRRRNGFEINFGFAGARHAVEQRRRERLDANIGNQRCCCRLLCVRQCRRREIGIGQRIRRIDRHFDGFDRTDLDQPADHRIGNIGDKRQFAHQPLPLADPLERLRALRGYPVRHRARRPIFDHDAPVIERRCTRQCHPQDCRRGRKIIVRRPFDQAPQRRRNRRQIISRYQIAQPVIADFGVRRHPLGLPHHARKLPRPEGRKDNRTRRDGHALRHAVVERAKRRIEQKNTRAGHRSSLAANMRGGTTLRRSPEPGMCRYMARPSQPCRFPWPRHGRIARASP